MASWTQPSRKITSGGWIQIVVSVPGQHPRDITFFRGVPTSLDSFTSADPFGDSTAVINLPQVTMFDDPTAGDLVGWFKLFANVDIYWVPWSDPSAYGNINFSAAFETWIDPVTDTATKYAPPSFTYLDTANAWHYHYEYTDPRTKLWEGFVTSIDYTADDTSMSAQLQCQGALFQLDRYLQKPFYPPNPFPIETLIKMTFDHAHKPHLRTQPMTITWPSDWSKTIPRRNTTDGGAYALEGKFGDNWSGYASRDTGAWERCLTGYIQDNLSYMVVQQDASASTYNSQWTVTNNLEQPGLKPGRRPSLYVRANNRQPDFVVWLGTPGVTATFTRDGTQMANIAYGDGTAVDGTVWRNSIVSTDGSRTDYLPLAWDNTVYPYDHNKTFSKHQFAMEAYVQFGTGFNEDQAEVAARTMLKRDADPGYTGQMTLKIDPTADGTTASKQLPRWTLRAGMTVTVKGLAGTHITGVNFHITQVECAPNDGTVTLTLDSKYRDLLTVQEARARTRDPLTPTNMLQINRNSVVIQDRNAPWSYKRGSGFVPQASTKWWHGKPNDVIFPYTDWLKKVHPRNKGDFYARVNANATKKYTQADGTVVLVPDKAKKFTCVPVLLSERGTIRRTEMIVVDIKGNIVACPFHLSVYYTHITPQDMPRDPVTDEPDAFVDNGFTVVNPLTGLPQDPASQLMPHPDLIDGALWGGKYKGHFNRAGFYPGSEPEGSPCSGILVDENPWSYDMTQGNSQYNKNPQNNTVKTGNENTKGQVTQNITAWAMFYAEYHEPVYFIGRFIRQEPGES